MSSKFSGYFRCLKHGVLWKRIRCVELKHKLIIVWFSTGKKVGIVHCASLCVMLSIPSAFYIPCSFRKWTPMVHNFLSWALNNTCSIAIAPCPLLNIYTLFHTASFLHFFLQVLFFRLSFLLKYMPQRFQLWFYYLFRSQSSKFSRCSHVTSMYSQHPSVEPRVCCFKSLLSYRRIDIVIFEHYILTIFFRLLVSWPHSSIAYCRFYSFI